MHLENAARGPDIIVSYAWDADAVVQGFPGTEYASMNNERGEHGSFSPRDVHNTLLAAGPDFRAGFRDPLPSGNVDLAPTLAALLGLPLPAAQGRVLREALAGTAGRPLGAYRVAPAVLRPREAARGLSMRRVDGSPLRATRYSFRVQLKRLDDGGRSYTYFDYAAPERP